MGLDNERYRSNLECRDFFYDCNSGSHVLLAWLSIYTIFIGSFFLFICFIIVFLIDDPLLEELLTIAIQETVILLAQFITCLIGIIQIFRNKEHLIVIPVIIIVILRIYGTGLSIWSLETLLTTPVPTTFLYITSIMTAVYYAVIWVFVMLILSIVAARECKPNLCNLYT